MAARPLVPNGARDLGPLASNRVIAGELALDPRNPTALASYASEVSIPDSMQYHRFLPAGAFARAFGPAPATIAEVRADLAQAGLRVGAVSRNGLLVAFKGSAGRVDEAFHTRLDSYRLADGRTAIANATTLQLPSPLTTRVQAVVGLNTLLPPASAIESAGDRSGARTHSGSAQAEPARPGPVACKGATSGAAALGGLTDAQIAAAYGMGGLYKSGITGAGETIAVYELEPFNLKDISRFDECYFGSTATNMLKRVHTVAVDGGVPTGFGSGESELDIENVSALAPGATIDVYEAPPTDAGYLDNFNAIVSDDTAKIATSSWFSGCDAEVASEEPGLQQAENTIFEQAAAQGQTIIDAAGDAGSDACAFDSATPVAPYLSVSDPSDQPYVLSVGGTTITHLSTPPSEQVWNDGSLGGGGGGGISPVWPAPAWQATSKVPGIDDTAVIQRARALSGGTFCQDEPGLDAGTLCRQVPDVSANADEYTGITIYYDGQWTTIGGTSSSAPLWAAMLGDVESTPTCVDNGGTGFVSPLLYEIASVPAEYAASFNDIRVSNNDVYGINEGLYPATRGYDMASGLGSPRVTGAGGAKGLAYYLCTLPTLGRPVVSSVTPPVIEDSGEVTLMVDGSGFEAASVPDVAGVTVGTYDVPVSMIDVMSSSELSVTFNAAGIQQAAGTYVVSVTLTGGATSTPGADSRLTVYDAPGTSGASVPAVVAVDPPGGVEAGGTTVTIYGSGFDAQGAATAVTFGGVEATSFTVDSDSRITAVVPPFNSGSTTCLAGNDPTDDVCQTDVQVTADGETSPVSALVPEYSGPLPAPAGTTGLVPQPTEFDYLPAPQVTSVTFPTGVPALATNIGFSEVTVAGVGLGVLGLEWMDVGVPGRAAAMTGTIYSDSATSVQLLLPPEPPTATATTLQVAAQTLASPNLGDLTSTEEPSTTVGVVYAAQPSVKSVSTANHFDVGPDTGGTRITVTGSGFDNGPYIDFEPQLSPFGGGTDYNVTPSPTSPDTELSATTTAEMQGADYVIVCNAANCAYPVDEIVIVCTPGGCFIIRGTVRATFTFYPLGNPRITSIRPHKAPAGAVIVIRGHNIGVLEGVYFGTTKSRNFGDALNINTFESSDNLAYAVIPPGTVGKTVDVRVVTAESEVRKLPESPVTPNDRFTYTRRHPPRT